MAQFFFF